MSILTIYGASDDLVEVTGEYDDEFGAYNGWRGKVIAPNGDSLMVIAEFGKAGSDADWTLSIENTGTWPTWPIRFGERPDRGGDPAIIIDVPAGTVVREVEA
jgi:hypothetical protein